MKLNKIALGVAAALAAQSAFALTPAQLDASTKQLWITGATAPTQSVYKGVRKLCLDANADGIPDDLHVYVDGGTKDVGKFNAYACTIGGEKTIVYHTADIGSFEAYTPHLLAITGPIPSVGITSTVKRLNNIKTAACVANGTIASTTDPVYTGCGNGSVTIAPNASVTALPTLPQGGFSDTEYLLNKLNLGISVDLGAIGGEVSSNVGQGFGIGVSNKLYYTMQVKQFGAGACTTGFSESNLNITAACQPNVTQAQYTSVIAQGANGDKDASVFGASPGTLLQVQRRVGTSGTQSMSNLYFLNVPCATGSTPGGDYTLDGNNDPSVGSTFALPNPASVVNPNASLEIRSNTGSGDVRSFLSSTSVHVMGVLSLENSQTGNTSGWKWVKLDGVSPNFDRAGTLVDNAGKNRQSMLDGGYNFWAELVAFTATTAYPEGASLISGVVTAWTDPTITNLQGIFPTPLAGVAAPANTVSQGYRDGNSCRPPVFANPAI